MKSFLSINMSCIIQILNQVVPNLSLNDAIITVCQQVVNIMKLRLESDLNSIIHNELDFDMEHEIDQLIDNEEKNNQYEHDDEHDDEYDDEYDEGEDIGEEEGKSSHKRVLKKTYDGPQLSMTDALFQVYF